MTLDLDSLVSVEQTSATEPRIDPVLTFLVRFFDAGYSDGYAHGRIHGLIEGRALGREKGFEMWEELAFYEGFARTWLALYSRTDRTAQHLRHLLDLIAQFPQVNPSAADRDSDLDILKLSRQIQSRYRALCASLGVKPALVRASQDAATTETPPTDPNHKSVWKVENQSQALSF
ncbi:DUF1715-domain-containing protein [Mycena kentingensis (nom. inval.)]|nr:DUF1715-domain-containing protein [Mycena kentingensis (nom. inval.)]